MTSEKDLERGGDSAVHTGTACSTKGRAESKGPVTALNSGQRLLSTLAKRQSPCRSF